MHEQYVNTAVFYCTTDNHYTHISNENFQNNYLQISLTFYDTAVLGKELQCRTAMVKEKIDGF